ncbi:MAG: hypothetical protein ACRETL_17660 [Gammaproteobacteria bacterium]
MAGIEACASTHYWAREIAALGHTVKLMLPACVKPYVKRQKNDAADAKAFCEAVQRPRMRLVPNKGTSSANLPGPAPVTAPMPATADGGDQRYEGAPPRIGRRGTRWL